MKAKLLKKLRKRAKEIFFLESDYPCFMVCKGTSISNYTILSSGLSFDKAKSELVRYRRRFILREIRILRDEKINKMLKKL